MYYYNAPPVAKIITQTSVGSVSELGTTLSLSFSLIPASAWVIFNSNKSQITSPLFNQFTDIICKTIPNEAEKVQFRQEFINAYKERCLYSI
ncbi:hypothetical protein [Rickettsiales endosymbiont of Stachyamoeba lipophora]|uniref:hypothetical protein n=1 Tax=Rickettsiales endosymbiont of Stachyamoeba lipophora TaxID=2486578 RepID=UPI000F65035A|nr:hypothetical protein [Rickettsiales endosymbiont of Stachyamoeba lipophora]AZL15457.1 hypothetical protein EF513_02670 [Rickettsiales endosymbiont of Stachyamoeba lipophora]